jgi:hypothetical protein
LTIYFFKLIWESLKNFAKAKEVAALANSELYCESFQVTNNVDQLWFYQRKRPANDNKETTK